MEITSIVAKSEDGTIQITFTIPKDLVEKEREKAVVALSENVEIPGFRKGKAPLSKAREKLTENSIIEKTLNQILPKALADAIDTHKLKPAIYPKFELVSAKAGEDWQIRAETCELPQFELPDYKSALMKIKKKADLTPDVKEQTVIKVLLETTKLEIPKILIQEEVNLRLSNLLARIEKLGLTLETYLPSVGKTPETLRQDYEKQAKEAISLELILNKKAESENIKITDTQIEEAVKAATSDPNIANRPITPEYRRAISAVLARKTVLDELSALL